MNTVPMYEAKNKLPLFMHQAEESGPVFLLHDEIRLLASFFLLMITTE